MKNTCVWALLSIISSSHLWSGNNDDECRFFVTENGNATLDQHIIQERQRPDNGEPSWLKTYDIIWYNSEKGTCSAEGPALKASPDALAHITLINYVIKEQYLGRHALNTAIVVGTPTTFHRLEMALLKLSVDLVTQRYEKTIAQRAQHTLKTTPSSRKKHPKRRTLERFKSTNVPSINPLLTGNIPKKNTTQNATTPIERKSSQPIDSPRP